MILHLQLYPYALTVLYLSLLSGAVDASSYTNSPFHTLPMPQFNETFAYRPPQVPLDVENYPIAPAGLELQQVHVYVRHGERAPVGVRLATPPASIPEDWLLCKHTRNFKDTVHELAGGPQLGYVNKVVERKDGSVVEGQCLLGELTDIGRESTFNYGRALRKLYVNRLAFLPDILQLQKTAYFRTTNMPRTMDSLQHIIYGLYPESKCAPSVNPTIRVRNPKDENLLGNTFACKRLELLLVGFAQAAAKAYNPVLAGLDTRLSKYLGGQPIRVDGKPRASGIMDTVRAAIAHGIKVPAEFEDQKIVDVIEQAVVTEWFADKTEEGRRLGMGRLLDDLTRNMRRKVENDEKDATKILIHATHDTALAALCSTLDVFNEKWPAFTASITFELFKQKEQQQNKQRSFSQTIMSALQPMQRARHYVRMRYQNENMMLPSCASAGDHLPGFPEFCTLDAFHERVNQLTPRDFETECTPAGKAN